MGPLFSPTYSAQKLRSVIFLSVLGGVFRSRFWDRKSSQKATPLERLRSRAKPSPAHPPRQSARGSTTCLLRKSSGSNASSIVLRIAQRRCLCGLGLVFLCASSMQGHWASVSAKHWHTAGGDEKLARSDSFSRHVARGHPICSSTLDRPKVVQERMSLASPGTAAAMLSL